MLRAVCAVCCERPARRGPLRLLRAAVSSAAPAQTVLTAASGPPSPAAPPAPPPSPPQPPQPPPPRRAWPTGAAVALALATSLGGVYMWSKKQTDLGEQPCEAAESSEAAGPGEEGPQVPALASAFPARVDFLVAGAGTAAFAALRALRAARPEATVLLVGEERALPYMRPPLSKELWREPALAEAHVETLSFRQWNGRRRPLAYEPEAFYAPVDALAGGSGGAAVARGWRVAELDVAGRRARVEAPGQPEQSAWVAYEACLLATGAAPRRLPALAAAAAAGRSLPLRTLADAARLAREADAPHVRTVAVLGGGFLACELSAALAERLAARPGPARRVLLVLPEAAPMAAVLPRYLQEEAARRLEAAGVTLVRDAHVRGCEVRADGSLVLALSTGARLDAQLAVEALGATPEDALARAAGLETHPELGGVVVNAELQARQGLWAAGDVACFHDALLGRRRVEHHDHAVLSGRLAGENMAAATAPLAPGEPRPAAKAYAHQSMFWSDLGPQLGYEAVGVIDSRLPTVGVFSADAVTSATATATAEEGAPAPGSEAPEAPAADDSAPPEARRYARGVVFYTRDSRVVGVLLWNLFNRMHVARQVLARGEFDDLLEVGKLFAPHEEE